MYKMIALLYKLPVICRLKIKSLDQIHHTKTSYFFQELTVHNLQIRASAKNGEESSTNSCMARIVAYT